MKRLLTAVFILVLALSAASLWALPLNGYNELTNPGFSTGNLFGWQAGTDIAIATDGPGHDFAATCKRPGGDLWLRQIVDDSASPGWIPTGTAKKLDLMAEITWSAWDAQYAAVSFRLDWWDPIYNTVSDPTTLPHYFGAPPAGSDPQVGYFTGNWVTAPLAGTNEKQWVTVNPFNQVLLPVQPRWVSVEVKFTQPEGVSVWLDNLNLTGQCVPEPSGLLIMLTGAAPLALTLRRFMKK